MVAGTPKYVTSVSQSDMLNGWRENREKGGVIIDIETDRIITDELSMPHSPRVANGVLWVLDSGRGYIARVDEMTGRKENVAFCPGFLRGLTIWNGHAHRHGVAAARRKLQGSGARSECPRAWRSTMVRHSNR